MSRLLPFFTYFGGKWRSAKHYPKPQHQVLIEPFAGSAGYSLNYPDRLVYLSDSDEIVMAVWDYLITVSESEVLNLPLVVHDVRDLDIVQEAKWLIGFWLNKGMTAPCNIPSKWMRDHATDLTRLNTYWGAGVRNRIAVQLQYIRHWRTYHKGYSSLINSRATWFIDPPYLRSGIRYRKHVIDYEHLGNWCRSREGQVIVCEQEGAQWLPFQSHRQIKTLEGKYGSKSSQEVIWIQQT